MEETISLQEFFQTLRKRMLLIFSITLLVTALSGVISFYFITPIYESSTQLLINQEDTNTNQMPDLDIQTNLQLINTYSIIIKSPAILDLVIKELALENMTTQSLNKKINVNSEGDSQVVTITVQDADQYIARDIANSTADIFQREITDLMNINNVGILAKATASEKQEPVKPQPILNIAISMVIGFLLSIGLAFLLEYLDNTLTSEQDIEKLLSLPVIGSISSMEIKEQKKIARLNKMQQK
ncbi:Wzz/FepE/Etk N-terminal domain-containing protein [Paenisporosarcina sp. FSL H8-0542]|uniref:YveK family protein n=1 Tax=Paenisporosarcina sp. FSL H8-0542 TaxID=2921401 RepID=UPI003159C15B